MAKYLATDILQNSSLHHIGGVLCLAAVAFFIGSGKLQAQELATSPAIVAPSFKAATPVTSTNNKRLTPNLAPVTSASKPDWQDLSPSQRQALAPLAASWTSIDEPRKRKWLAISQNFASLPDQEQARMHSRMKEWAALSPQERVQARLNFAGARELPSEKRIEKWEAYKALPSEQRQHLAATAPGKPTGAATAVKPAQPKKQPTMPPMAAASAPNRTTTGTTASGSMHIPRIAAGTHEVDQHTLLPIPPNATPEATKQP